MIRNADSIQAIWQSGAWKTQQDGWAYRANARFWSV